MSGEKDELLTSQQMFAAEFALGLLEGDELLEARARIGRDMPFTKAVEDWEERLAPLFDSVEGAEPSPQVWRQIEAHIAGAESARAGGADIIDLRARVKRWQWTAAITSAAAAVLLAVMVFSPGSEPGSIAPSGDAPVLAAADPLVAQVPIGDTGLRLDVTYIPESEQLLVGAIGLTADGVHDHELWLVPSDGSPLQSLGVVTPGEVLGQELSAEIIANMGDGVQLVLTREPIGGKPEGVNAGPVVAEGAFRPV